MDIRTVPSPVRSGPFRRRGSKKGDEFLFEGIGDVKGSRIGTDIDPTFIDGRHELAQIRLARIVKDLARRILFFQPAPLLLIVPAA